MTEWRIYIIAWNDIANTAKLVTRVSSFFFEYIPKQIQHTKSDETLEIQLSKMEV